MYYDCNKQSDHCDDAWLECPISKALVTYRECIKDNIALHLPAYGKGFLPVYYSHEFYTT